MPNKAFGQIDIGGFLNRKQRNSEIDCYSDRGNGRWDLMTAPERY